MMVQPLFKIFDLRSSSTVFARISLSIVFSSSYNFQPSTYSKYRYRNSTRIPIYCDNNSDGKENIDLTA